LPPGATGTFNPAAVSSSGTVNYSIITTSTTLPGTYAMTFSGISGSYVHSAGATMVVLANGDYYVMASPATQSVIAGNSATYEIDIYGGSQTVWFSTTGLPAGASAVFSPGLVTGGGATWVTVSTGTSTPAGTYPLTFTASNGTTTHTATAVLVVTAVGSFTIAVSPSSQTASISGSTSYSFTVYGASGNVSLTLSGLPGGASAAFSPPSLNGSGSGVLDLATGPYTVPGTYTLTITATNGSLKATATASLVVTSSAN